MKRAFSRSRRVGGLADPGFNLGRLGLDQFDDMLDHIVELVEAKAAEIEAAMTDAGNATEAMNEAAE